MFLSNPHYSFNLKVSLNYINILTIGRNFRMLTYRTKINFRTVTMDSKVAEWR